MKVGLISECLEHAPCYWQVGDDGADFRCADCGEYGKAGVMLFTLTPDGRREMMHRDCICPDWLANAKDMKGVV